MRKILAVASTLAVFAASACGDGSGDGGGGGGQQFTLTVQKGGTGAGTVTGTGIACGSDCTEKLAGGTQVTLTAAPDAASQIAGWTGCDSSAGVSCTVSLDKDRTVTATFNAASQTVVSTDITTATTWPAGAVYRVTKAINVTAPLTIQAGVQVLFDADASLHVTSTLTVDGQSAATPVVFTSSAASPSGGAWAGIELAASGSSFNQCAILFAGAKEKAALRIGANLSASVTHCTFAHHKTPTDTISSTPALDASDAAAGTILKDNLFFDDRVPLAVNTTFSVEANAFDNSAAAANNPQPSKYNGVFVRGCAHVASNLVWPALAVPYVIGDQDTACNWIVVDNGGQLAIGSTGANAVVKFFEHGNISAAGVLIGHAVFTSIKDDRLGDTNGDGAASAPAGGDWEGISLSKNGSVFDNARFSYGGGGDFPALRIGSSRTATVTNTTFAHNRPTTATVTAPPALDASDAAAGTVIANNTFFDNTVPLAMNTTLPIDDSNAFVGHEGAGADQGNKFQAIVVTGCGHIATDITWSAIKVPLVIGDPATACNWVQVDSGGHLTIADGVVVKFFGHGSLDAQGIVTANATTQIVFTSFRDDAHGGDTNADGATAPAGGDWRGVYAGMSGSTFNKVLFLYGGGAQTGENASALYVSSGKSVSVINSVFAHNRSTLQTFSAPPALDLSDAASTAVVQGTRFFDNTIPLAINGTISLDDSNEFVSGVPAAPQPDQRPGVLVQGCTHVTATTTWLVTKVPLVIGDPDTACKWMQVDNGAHLVLGPNLTMKFFNDGSLSVSESGILTVDASDWLTCIADDRLNDTNADGSGTAPVVGDWYGVKSWHSSGPSPTCDQSAYMHWQAPNTVDNKCSW
jgi:hypothetical protein